MSVVFLFDMGVVIFLVGPATSELDTLLIAEGLCGNPSCKRVNLRLTSLVVKILPLPRVNCGGTLSPSVILEFDGYCIEI